MTGKTKTEKTRAKPASSNKQAANKPAASPQWAGLMGDGVEAATAVREALSLSLDVLGAETLAYSSRAIEQSVSAASELADVKSIGDVVEVQTRVAVQAWHEAFDYWTKMGESAAQTAQKGFLAS